MFNASRCKDIDVVISLIFQLKNMKHYKTQMHFYTLISFNLIHKS